MSISKERVIGPGTFYAKPPSFNNVGVVRERTYINLWRSIVNSYENNLAVVMLAWMR